MSALREYNVFVPLLEENDHTSKTCLPQLKLVHHCRLFRLQKELMVLMMSTEQGVSAFPEGENLFKWIGTITGPRDTVRLFDKRQCSLQIFKKSYIF